MRDAEDTERAVLDEHEARWIEQGYRVVRHPKGHDVPEFLGRFQPDAVAIGPVPNLIVEVVRKGAPNAVEKVERLKTLIGDRKDWRLEVLYVGEADGGVAPTTSAAIEDLLSASRRIVDQEPRGTLLLAWAALEALARRLEPTRTTRPQTPGRVVELLAGAGHVTPTDAQSLRSAVVLRNHLIHGDLSAQPSTAEVRVLLDVVEELLRALQRREQAV